MGTVPDDFLLSLPPMLLLTSFRAALLLPYFVSAGSDQIRGGPVAAVLLFRLLSRRRRGVFPETLIGCFFGSSACFFDGGRFWIGLRFHGCECWDHEWFLPSRQSGQHLLVRSGKPLPSMGGDAGGVRQQGMRAGLPFPAAAVVALYSAFASSAASTLIVVSASSVSFSSAALSSSSVSLRSRTTSPKPRHSARARAVP